MRAASLFEPGTHRPESPIHVVVNRFRIRPADNVRDGFGRHFLYHVQLDGHALFGTERAQRLFELFASFAGSRVLVIGIVDRRNRTDQLPQNAAAPAIGHRAVRRADLGQELAEREIEADAGLDQLVSFDVTSLIQEDALEDLTTQWRKLRRRLGQPPAAVAMPKPINGEIADDGDEPGGEARAMNRLRDVTAQAFEIIRA